jgi:hypothetical protein
MRRSSGGRLLAAAAIGSYQLRLGYHSTAILFFVIGLVLLAVMVFTSPSLRHRLAATAGITVLTGLVGVVVYCRRLLAGARRADRTSLSGWRFPALGRGAHTEYPDAVGSLPECEHLRTFCPPGRWPGDWPRR